MLGNVLTVAGTVEMIVADGNGYAPGDESFVTNLEVNGTLSAGANNITINGSFDATGGLVTSTGTFIFTSTETETIISGGNTLGSVKFNGSTGTWILEDALDLTGSLVITTGTLDIKSGEINDIFVGGNWINAGTFLGRTGTVTFDGTSNHTITSNSSTFYNIKFNGTGGTWTLEDNMDVQGTLRIAVGTLDANNSENNEIDVASHWINNATFNARNGTVTFDAIAGTPTITSGSSAFYHMAFDDTANGITWTLQDNLDMNGNLLITGGNLDVNNGNNYQVNIGGDWSNNDVFTPRNGTVIFDGTAGSFDITSGSSAFYNMQINDGGGGGTFVLEDTLDIDGTITLTNGILDTNVSENNEIQVAGNWIRIAATFTPRNGTVVFDSTSADQTITSNTEAFYNLQINNTAGASDDDIILVDAFDVNGTLTITDGELDASTNNPALNIGGSWVTGGSGDFTPGTSTTVFDGAGGSFNITSAGESFGSIEFNDGGGSSSTWEIQDVLDVDGTIRIIDGALDVNSGNNYTINLSGGWIVETAGTFNAQQGTVIFDATSGAPLIFTNMDTFHNIDFDDSGNNITFTLEDTLDIDGTLRINNGSLDIKVGEDNDINVAGAWINNGTFVQRAGEVTLDGTDQAIYGTTTFYDLTKLETTNDSTNVTVTMDTTGSLVIENIWNFNGLDSDDLIVLQPDVAATHWDLDPMGLRAISFLNPTYGNNVNATTIDCTNQCVDGTNNINWNFVAGVITVSGTVYTDETESTGVSGVTVQLDINGAADMNDVTDGSGGYSINTGIAVGSGAVLTLSIDGATEGVTVLISDGTTVSNVDLYQDYLMLRVDNGAFMTNFNLNTADNSGDADIADLFSVTSGNTLQVVNSKELIILEGSEYRPNASVEIGTSGETTTLDLNGTLTMGSGETLTVRGTLDSSGEFTGSSATIDVNGTLAVTTGTFNAPSTAMTVSGTIDLASGTYAHNSGILTLDGAQQQTVASGTNTFNEILVANTSSSTVFFTEAFTTANFRNTTPSSKMSFMESTTYTVTNTLSLVGSSGNEIRLNSIDLSTRFTFDVTGGSQSVSFVDVANSESSTNNIVANNSIDGVNTDSSEGGARWTFINEPDLKIETGQFTIPVGSGGTFDITSVSFTPKAMIFILTKNATDDVDSTGGSGNGGMISIGMTDGTRHVCMASGSEDGQTTSDVGRRGFQNDDAILCNIDVADDTQTVLGEYSFNMFLANGIRFNQDTAFTEPTSMIGQFIAIGGGDVAVRVDKVDLNDTQDATEDVTSVGFEPDLILSAFIGHLRDSNGNSNNDDHSISFGWAVNPDVQTNDNQYSVTTASQDNVGTTASKTRIDDTRAGVSIRDDVTDVSFEIDNFDASGFDVTTRFVNATTNEVMGYLALDITGTPQIYSGIRDTRTSAGNDVVGSPAFEPIFLMGLSSAIATSTNTDTDGGSMTIGMTDGTDTIAVAFHDEDNVGTSSSQTRSTTSQFMVGYDDDGTIDWEANFSSFDDNGWTLNFADPSTSAFKAAYLAIGLSPASPTISGQAFLSDGVTNIGANKTISMSVNGGAVIQSVETDASGNFDFTIATSANDVITLFIDDETENGVSVTVSSGGLITMSVITDHLVVQHNNSGSLTNANLATADDSGDSDITSVYTMSSNELTVVDGIELFVPTGETFAPGDVVNADNVDINGVFTPPANIDITVSGTFDSTGGTFTTTGTVIFDATVGTIDVIMNGQALNNVIFDDGGGSATWEFAGTFDVDGFFLLTDGILDFATNNAPAEIARNFTINGGTFNPPVTTIVWDGIKTFTDNTMQNVGTILITPDTTLASDFVASSLTIAAGDTLITDGYEIDLSANIRVDGTLDARSGTDGPTTINVGRNWRSQSGLLIMGNSTVVMDDSSGSNIFRTGDTNTFYNVIFDDANGGADTTWELRDNINIWGTLQILDGTVDARDGVNEPIELRGNWNSTGGTFIPRQGTITFAGTGEQTITVDDDTFYNVSIFNSSGSTVFFIGSTTFNDFVSTVGSSEINFEAGETYQIDGSLRLDGQAAGTRIVLNSSDYNTRFNFDVTNESPTVAFVDVRNSEALSNDIIANNSLDTTNTDFNEGSPQWFFGMPISISGTSNLADATMIAIAINASLQGTTTTVSSGAWTLSPIVANAGDIVTVWGDGIGESLESTAITEYDGVGNITGMLLNSGTLAIGSNDGTINIDMTELGQYDNNDDEDIIYSLDSSNHFQSENVPTNLHILNTGSFVTDGYDMNIWGTLNIAGTLDASSGAGGNTNIYVQGSWDATGGLFTSTNSTVILTGTDTGLTLTSSDDSFNNLIINGTTGLIGYWKLDEAVSPAMDSSGYSHAGTWQGSPTAITGTTSTINFHNPMALDFNANTDYVLIPHSETLSNLSSFTLSAWARADGNPGASWGRIIHKSDGGTSDDYAMMHRATTLQIVFRVHIGGGITNITGDPLTPGQGWMHVAAVWDGSNMTLYQNGEVSAGPTAVAGVLRDSGEPLAIGRHENSSARDFDGAIDEVRIYARALSATEISRLAKGFMPATGVGLYTLQDNLDVNGTFVINDGTLNTGTDRQINVAGSWLNHGGIFTSNNSQVILDGTALDLKILSGSQTFYDIDQTGSGTWSIQDNLPMTGTFDVSAGVLTYPASSTIERVGIDGGTTLTGGIFTGTTTGFRHDGDMIIASGTYTASSGVTEIGGSFTHSGGTFTNSSGTVMFTGTSALHTIDTTGGAIFQDMIVNDGLVGYWKLDELNDNDRVIDYSGYEAHGTAMNFGAGGGPSLDIDDDFHFENPRSLEFDGADDVVAIGNPDHLQELGPLTYTAWIKPASEGESNNGRIISKDVGTDIFTPSWRMEATNTLELTYRGTVVSLVRTASDNAVTLNVWQHVAVTWDGSATASNVRMYVDGVETGYKATTDGVGLIEDIGTEYYIGSNDLTNRSFDGFIDEARIYNRILSLAEIQTLANGDQPSTGLGAYTLQTALDVDGTLRLNSGTLDVGSNRQMNVGADWENFGGVFNAQNGTVIFDGGDFSIPASETFYNIQKQITSASTVTFGRRSTITIQNNFDFDGFDASNYLTLQSSSVGTRWNIEVGSAQSATFLDVRDSEALGFDITASDSLDTTNNDSGEGSPQWVFSSSGPLKGAIIIVD